MLAEINAFIKRTGMKETRFGRTFAQDPRLVSDLRKGRQMRQRSIDRIRCEMAKF